MSSVNPSESASQAGKKKNRPGKNARAAMRAGQPPTASAQTAPSSASGASFFSSQLPADPVPQPGRFPVVFTTGVGEPTRDIDLAYDGESIHDIATKITDRYIYNPRYAEFSSHSGYTDEMFGKDLVRFFLLGIAQQTVHAHVNMGLPLGDFSSIASTDVFLPTSLGAVVSQFGEFSLPQLGTRYLLRNYETTVSSLVHAASQVRTNAGKNAQVLKRLWLPMKIGDTRTRFLLASALSRFISAAGLVLDVDDLARCIFNEKSSAFELVKPLLGDDDAARDRFDFLFKGYTSEVTFVTLVNTPSNLAALAEIGVTWDNPDVSHLDFSFIPKVKFPELVDEWARKKAAVQKFLSTRSGLANRSAASGTAAQISEVITSSGITVVKTHVALPAPELSLLACFPSTSVFGSSGPLNVVVTTSIPVDVRATEFAQLDWLG